MDARLTIGFSSANAAAPVTAEAVAQVAIHLDARLPGGGSSPGASVSADLSAQLLVQFAPETASDPAGWTDGGGVDGGGVDGSRFTATREPSPPQSTGDPAATSTCQRLTDRIRWRPSPTRFPEWRVDQVTYESKGCDTSEDLPKLTCLWDSATNQITTDPEDAFLTVMWPEDLRPFMSPWQGYAAATVYQPPLDPYKREPTVGVVAVVGLRIFPGAVYADGHYSIAVPAAALAPGALVEIRLVQGRVCVERRLWQAGVDLVPFPDYANFLPWMRGTAVPVFTAFTAPTAPAATDVTIIGTVGDQWMAGERAVAVTCIGPLPLSDAKGAGNDRALDKLGLRIPCRLMFDHDLVLVDRSRVGTASAPPTGPHQAMQPKMWQPDPKQHYLPGERLDGRVTIAPKDSAMRIDTNALQTMADDFSLGAVDLTRDIEVTMEVGAAGGRVAFEAQATCRDGSTIALKHPAQWQFSRDPSMFYSAVVTVPVARISFDNSPDWLIVEWAGSGSNGSDGGREEIRLRDYYLADQQSLNFSQRLGSHLGGNGSATFSITVNAKSYKGGDGSGNGKEMARVGPIALHYSGHCDSYDFRVTVSSPDYAIVVGK